MSYEYDPSSCILPPRDRKLEIKHFHLFIRPDFDSHCFFCTIHFFVEKCDKSSNSNENLLILLDVHNLHIDYVRYQVASSSDCKTIHSNYSSELKVIALNFLYK